MFQSYKFMTQIPTLIKMSPHGDIDYYVPQIPISAFNHRLKHDQASISFLLSPLPECNGIFMEVEAGDNSRRRQVSR